MAEGEIGSPERKENSMQLTTIDNPNKVYASGIPVVIPQHHLMTEPIRRAIHVATSLLNILKSAL